MCLWIQPSFPKEILNFGTKGEKLYIWKYERFRWIQKRVPDIISLLRLLFLRNMLNGLKRRNAKEEAHFSWNTVLRKKNWVIYKFIILEGLVPKFFTHWSREINWTEWGVK